MKAISVLLISLALVISNSFSVHTGLGFNRSRRSLLEFKDMIKAATKRNPLDYNGYGCYCGLGGRGRALDQLDRCCQSHDNCYTVLTRNRVCIPLHLYILFYKRSSRLTCSSSNRGCARGLCECDRTAAYCFSRARFNNRFKNYNKRRC